MTPAFRQKLKGLITVGSEVVRWAVLARLFHDVLALDGDKLRLREEDEETMDEEYFKTTVALSHEEASAMLRMTYAFCDYSVQGATLRDRHIVLFDTNHWMGYFTVRHLIVRMSRATHGQYVHVLSTEQEKEKLLLAAA